MPPDLLRRFADQRVLVIGDALLDAWLTGRPSRLCREGPVAVVDLDGTRYACGGASNTAVNVAALGGNATLVCAVGADEAGDRVRARLAAAGAAGRVVAVPGRHTATKRRLLADGQVVARMDEGDRDPLPDRYAHRLVALADAALADGCAAVVVCDYDAGTLTRPVRQWLARVRRRLPLLVVDAHDLRPWAQLAPDLVTPNFAEAAELVPAGPPTDPAARADWVARHAAELAAAARAATVAVTLDADGAVLVEHGAATVRTRTRPAPPAWTTGAGDSYVAAFTLALAAGATPAEAGEVAQRAAEIAVSGTGTAVCPAAELAAATGGSTAVVDAPTLARLVAGYRARGRRIVFTNGCFDVLHAGHVQYLAEARRQADCLIVAINSDESVRQLKGPTRPLNAVEARALVLAGLQDVDYVTIFADATPAAVIEAVRPDVLVKGADYPKEKVVGAQFVESYGGRVHLAELRDGFSTTGLIERMKAA